MWGTQSQSADEKPGIWFIPTHVGNSTDCQKTHPPLAVHPHACGELLEMSTGGWSGNGSSPRMWGTLTPQRSRGEARRFIPTHVGNSINVAIIPAP